MKILLALCIAAGAPLFSPTARAVDLPTPHFAEKLLPPKPDTTLDPTGYYLVVGKLPKGFGRIDHLNLATVDQNGQPAPLNGMIRLVPRSVPDYRTVSIKLDGRHLTFTTASVKGISYSFDGTFDRTGDFSADPPPYDAVVLRGTLTKLKNGKPVIARDVRFNYTMGD